MQKQKKTAKVKAQEVCYSVESIVDAPEHYEYARAMGLLTWGIWNHEPRPYEERLKDFTMAFPIHDPTKFQGSMLCRTKTGHFGPAAAEGRQKRFLTQDNTFGGYTELLARYGLKSLNSPSYTPTPIVDRQLREITIVRNQKLRVLHGSVDVEPLQMDEAKAAELDRLEKKQAAEEVRLARERMKEEK